MLNHALVQEFVPSDGEYMFAGLYDRGQPIYTFQHRQIRGDSYTGGGSVYRRSMYDSKLEATAHALLAHLNWHGLACIEYIKHARTGEYVLTEINPRFWRSLPLTVRAGADFPYYYWLLTQGREGAIEQGYDLNVGSHFLWGELRYLRSVVQEDCPIVRRPPVLRETLRVLGSVLRDPHLDYL